MQRAGEEAPFVGVVVDTRAGCRARTGVGRREVFTGVDLAKQGVVLARRRKGGRGW